MYKTNRRPPGFGLLFATTCLLCHIVLSISLSAAPAAAGAKFTQAPASASAGYFALGWSTNTGNGVPEFEVQESTTENFENARTIYTGPDTGTTLSGRADGTFYYRVRAGTGDWSAIHSVTVEHHPLGRAFAFLGLGAIVFLSTAALILLGTRKERLGIAEARR